MKKIIKPAEKEESVYYSDFTGALLDDYSIPCELTLDFGYGSKWDGSKVVLHLNDKDAKDVMKFIASKLSTEIKEQYKKYIDELNTSYGEAVEWRSYHEAEIYFNNKEVYQHLIDNDQA